MARIWSFGLLLWVCLMTIAVSGPAHASSDSTCYPRWSIKQSEMNGCSSTALLSPGNDTRVNMLMLLHDRHGAVGSIDISDYDALERQGEAQPFGFATFANALGPKRAEPEVGAQTDNNDFAFGTRCMTNDSGAYGYITALAKAKAVPTDERATLSAIRTMMKPRCIDGETAKLLVTQGTAGVKSKEGQNFARYLIGAAAFYDGDYDGASSAFAGTLKTGSPWLAQAVSYMIGRAALNKATSGAFDAYGSLNKDKANADALRAAEQAFAAYIKTYPAGEYTASARGLLRRVYWLGDKTDQLIAEYVAAFAQGDSTKRNISLAELVQEADIKMLDHLSLDRVRDPLLLAVLDLKAMRHDDDPQTNDYGGPPITRATLEGQRGTFAGNEALFTYLLAVHAYYVEDNADQVLRVIPANMGNDGTGYLDFSRHLLRALALDQKGDAGARGALISLIPAGKKPFQRGSAELALAMHLERNKSLDLVFAKGSPVRDGDIREILLRYTAGPDVLRGRVIDQGTVPRERAVALFALLYKQITRGRYADFVRDLALIPGNTKPRAEDDYTTPAYTQVATFNWAGSAKGYACPSIRSVAGSLAVTRNDPKSLLCLGDFVRLNDLDPGYYGVASDLDTIPPPTELGGTRSLFPGKAFSRLEIYKQLLSRPDIAANERAYALYRAVNCYAPSGYNSCGGVEVDVAQRKAWFQQLKRGYPNSPWAKGLQYYW